MNCCFIGHVDTPFEIRSKLKETLASLISEGVLDFYVGNNGNFDLLIQDVLVEMIKEGQPINLNVVLAYPNEESIRAEQKYTLYPEGLDNTPLRFAISKRNDLLIKNSHILVAYVRHRFSNSHKWVDKAKKNGLKVINLADHPQKHNLT